MSQSNTHDGEPEVGEWVPSGSDIGSMGKGGSVGATTSISGSLDVHKYD
jgi:hypothetical protein